jgi:pimeloyl-ACP methyl ester carboxylesterase
MSSIVSDNGKQQKRELSSADDYWEKGFDPFERDGNVENEEPADGAARAVKVLIEKLELDLEPPRSRPRSFDTPIFLGHGDQDENVAMARGKEAAECLRALGFDVSWSEYQGLGHWYSAEMLTDMTIFLRARAGCEKENETFVTGITA